MSSQRLCSRPWVADEDLYFDKLFSNDEVSDESSSQKQTLFSSQASRHRIPPPPSFSQILFSQQTGTQSKNTSPRPCSQSKTVVKVQPQKQTRQNPPRTAWQKFSNTKDNSESYAFYSDQDNRFKKTQDDCQFIPEDNTVFEGYSGGNEIVSDFEDVEYGDYPFEKESTSNANGPSFQTPSQMTLTVPSSRGPHNATQKLRPVTEIPEQFRFIFGGFPYFNFVQSKVFDDVLYTDKPIVVCSPTGSGKTVVFELAIIRLLMNLHGEAKNFKIIYMAPMKALCSERYEDWSKKFNPVGLTCKELTGDSEMDDYLELQRANIVMTTPEKWDSMTRKWKDNRALVQAVRLFLIDEVHLLNDESRGPTMEAVISRMKTVKTAESRASRQKEIFGANMRFLAISATIPNTEDIGEWLGTAKYPAANYCMDESYRPVKLRKVVIGYSWSENMSNYRFDLSLNYKLSSIIQTYSDDKPTLVFCSTRKGAQQAGSTLIKDARFVMNAEHRQRLQRCANSLHDSKLRELVMCGVGYHHAGLDTSDRKSIGSMFTRGELPVLFSTSTLAMGVNLPAHLVIIKSTMQYLKGVFQEYSESQILQMIGRAGRPQFDNSATAVIMTKYSNKMKYEAIIGGTQNIESCLHKNLIEHLNAEIVLNTITDVSIALEWLKSTFLYIRILKNPTYYGIPKGLDMDVLEKKLQEMCVKSLNTLGDHGLVHMDEGFDLRPSDTGKLMARYCIAFESMKLFLNLQGTEELNELITVVCQCKEFNDLKIRNNEKKVLNTLNKDKNRITIRFPINGRIKTTEQKINCLIQANLGCLPINEFALNQDVTKIFRSGQRVTKCLYECCMLQNNYNLLMNALQLSKCFRARLWENSKYISKQLEKVGLTMSTMLVNAGLTTFNKIDETNPREIELIVNRHPPFGNQIKEAVSCLPKYEVDVEQKTTYSVMRADLVVSVTMTNHMKRQENITKATGYHCCILLIADAENKIIHKQRLADAAFFSNGTWSKKIEVQRASRTSELKINVISQDIVGLDVHKTFTPYYTGPNTNFVRGDTKFSRNPPPQMATKETTKKKQIETRARQPCNHRCVNKHLCAHECCKNGVLPRKSTPKDIVNVNQPQIYTPKKDNTTRSMNSNMNSFVDQLHARNQAIPITPARKRLTSHFDTNQFEFEQRSPKRRPQVALAKFEYKPKPKINHQHVMEQVEHVLQDLEESDWQDMEFSQENDNKGNIELINLCDDIFDDEIEQDDWDFQYSYLDDNPSKMSSKNKPPDLQCTDETPSAHYPKSGNRSLSKDQATVIKPRCLERSFDQRDFASPGIRKTKDHNDTEIISEKLTHKPSFSLINNPRPILPNQRNASTMLPSSSQLKNTEFVTASHIASAMPNQYQSSVAKFDKQPARPYERIPAVQKPLISSAVKNHGTIQERMKVGSDCIGAGKSLATGINKNPSFYRPAVSNLTRQGLETTPQWQNVGEKVNTGSKAVVLIGQTTDKGILEKISMSKATPSFVKSTNSCQGYFNQSSWQSDEEDDNHDAFKNIFNDVL